MPPKKNTKFFSKNNSKKIPKTISKQSFKKWDPLIHALIPEMFEFPQSDK
jgi:hypothetical protein